MIENKKKKVITNEKLYQKNWETKDKTSRVYRKISQEALKVQVKKWIQSRWTGWFYWDI